MKQYRHNTVKIVVMINIGLLALMGCSKDDTPQPQPITPDTTVGATDEPIGYYNSQYVQDSMIGKWAIYKHTYIGTTNYEQYQPQPYDLITITSNTIQYNMDTPEPYTYNQFNIKSLSYNYYVKDMDQPNTWMYVLDSNLVLPTGIDTVYYSMAKVQ